MEKAEKEMAALEAEYENMSTLLADPETYKSKNSVEKVKHHKQVKEKIELAHLEWERHTKELEAYDKSTEGANSKL